MNICPSTISAASLTTVPDGYIAIYTVNDLDKVHNDLSKNYILMSDITFSDTNKWRYQVNPFTGTFDGNGHTIYGLNLLTDTSPKNIGFFSINEGIIKNLTLCDISFTHSEKTSSSNYIGAFAGINRGTIANCSFIKDKLFRLGIYNSHAGGIAGSNESTGSIIYCKNAVPLYSYSSAGTSQSIGGITSNNNGKILYCKNTASITAAAGSSYYTTIASAGGIAGANSYGNISKSYNSGTITSLSATYKYCGGIVGDYSGNLDNCYNIGTISTSATNYGGIAVGYSDSHKVSCCYTSTGSAFSFGTKPDYCYENLTSNELCDKATFEGFDFDFVWEMDERLKRPVFNENILKIKADDNKIFYQVDSYIYGGSAALYIAWYQDDKLIETREIPVILGTTENGSYIFSKDGTKCKLFLVDKITYAPLCISVES